MTIIGIVAGVLLLLAFGAFMMRGKVRAGTSAGAQTVGGQTPFAPPSIPAEAVVHPPCKNCGGFLQEMTHDGNRWTWCPACRAWQDFLGKI